MESIGRRLLQKTLNDEPIKIVNLTKVADDRVHLANILTQLELAKTDSLERKQLFDLLYIVFAEKPFSDRN